MSKITAKEVERITDLVRIAVTEEEVEKYVSEINATLDYASKLNELNTDDVEVTTHGITLQDIMRKDEPKQSITQEEALKNAPDKQDGHFKVPTTME